MSAGLIAVMFLIPGLATASDDKRVLFNSDGVSVIESVAQERVSYIKAEGSKDQYCEGTGSDFAKFGGAGFSLGGSDAAGKGSVGFGDSHGVEDLGGRSSALLITREMLYRACELSLNTDSNREQSIEIYQMFLKAIEQITGNSLAAGNEASTSSIAIVVNIDALQVLAAHPLW